MFERTTSPGIQEYLIGKQLSVYYFHYLLELVYLVFIYSAYLIAFLLDDNEKNKGGTFG